MTPNVTLNWVESFISQVELERSCFIQPNLLVLHFKKEHEFASSNEMDFNIDRLRHLEPHTNQSIWYMACARSRWSNFVTPTSESGRLSDAKSPTNHELVAIFLGTCSSCHCLAVRYSFDSYLAVASPTRTLLFPIIDLPPKPSRCHAGDP